MTILKIHTDGACSGNQSAKNIGGWGAILEYGQATKELYGGEKNTTNNRMEMTALIEALSQLKRDNLSIQVFSDSAYLIDCFTKKWYVKWKKNKWKKNDGKAVLNRELWERLIELVNKNDITFYKVKGHVDLDGKNTNIDNHYEKFLEKNENKLDMDDYIHAIEMNNRADQLANIAMDEIRNGKKGE